MLYHLFDWLRQTGVKVPGGALFQFITFRVLLAVILSLVITMLFGRRLINYLRTLQVGESVRELGLEGEQQKKGTPTMFDRLAARRTQDPFPHGDDQPVKTA